MTIIYKANSIYQAIQVGERSGVRYMRFGEEGSGWQGALVIEQPERLYFPYQQAFALHVAWLPTVQNFLAIGVGTGTAIRHIHRRHREAHVTGIDLDEQVIEVAARFFDLPTDKRCRYFAEDGLKYLDRIDDVFDLIFIDVFFHEQTPTSFFSETFIDKIRRHLAPEGIVAMNVIMTTAGPKQHHFWNLYTLLAQVIGPTYYVALGPLPFISQNIILFAHNQTETSLLLTDLRKNCMREVDKGKRYFAPYAKILPWRLKQK